MKDIDQILDIAKQKSGSDGKTAKALGLTRAHISAIRKKGSLSNEIAVKLAIYTDTELEEVIAAGEVKKHPEKEALWNEIIMKSEGYKDRAWAHCRLCSIAWKKSICKIAYFLGLTHGHGFRVFA